MALEVQGQIDPEKARRWVVMVSLKQSQTGQMGDLVVLTSNRAVAEWATTVTRAEGRLGTRLHLQPTIILLADEAIDALLDEAHPELAFFAAWAMQRRHGPEAHAVVRRALQISHRLPEPLREPTAQAIIRVLSKEMIALLKELTVNLKQLPEGEALREFRLEAFAEGEARGKAEGEARGKAEGEARGKAEGEARGKAEGEARGKANAIVAVLASRGLLMTAEQRARLLAITNGTQLDRYLARVASAKSVEELLS